MVWDVSGGNIYCRAIGIQEVATLVQGNVIRIRGTTRSCEGHCCEAILKCSHSIHDVLTWIHRRLNPHKCVSFHREDKERKFNTNIQRKELKKKCEGWQEQQNNKDKDTNSLLSTINTHKPVINKEFHSISCTNNDICIWLKHEHVCEYNYELTALTDLITLPRVMLTIDSSLEIPIATHPDVLADTLNITLSPRAK